MGGNVEGDLPERILEPNEIVSPQWHHDVLTEREFNVLSGDPIIEDWETTKSEIRELVSWK
jgi:hypothetical protein